MPYKRGGVEDQQRNGTASVVSLPDLGDAQELLVGVGASLQANRVQQRVRVNRRIGTSPLLTRVQEGERAQCGHVRAGVAQTARNGGKTGQNVGKTGQNVGKTDLEDRLLDRGLAERAAGLFQLGGEVHVQAFRHKVRALLAEMAYADRRAVVRAVVRAVFRAVVKAGARESPSTARRDGLRTPQAGVKAAVRAVARAVARASPNTDIACAANRTHQMADRSVSESTVEFCFDFFWDEIIPRVGS